ncbi:hypothetical protein SY88_22835 [Clostridiales bacterium PH28_bin88]|nr:hypothetical protein SY88_22835 [Clostridiales bacterium PH28_bin88]
MTELLDAKRMRQEILKGIILDLHAGKDLEELKARFAKLIQNVSASEIAEMEDRLIAEGMPPEEVKRMCDVHVAVFKEALEQQESPDSLPGHPVHTFRLENRAIEKVVQSLKELLDQLAAAGKPDLAGYSQALQSQLSLLAEIDKHYLRKENQLFPVLEKRGIYGPPKVMWQVHDDIRTMLKATTRAVDEGNAQAVIDHGNKLLTAVSDMIYKEENILFPMSLETLSESDWGKVRIGEEEIGYTLVSPGNRWQPPAAREDEPVAEPGVTPGAIKLNTGELSPDQVNLMLTHLPIDITFVDEHGQVRYYSQGMHRIFPRSPGIIGRKVQDCHPVDSVHVVNRIVEEFKTGSKDQAEFWLEVDGRFVHIRYFAVRDTQGNYRGVVEVTQDVTDIRALQGQKRLLDW